ncbi:hypothetical protein N7478_003175 [Penicillium angulare]|uniref:uncharacterized protein n=1 Tax=Penicillium angulare TaxID=116970 RepID=UPI00254007D2|nr:uncharacterized protein N7478_003175 [Penicillium angulare]KAJ5287489.1 hypothetical protein N7478_003175 [Penicillium angulare]
MSHNILITGASGYLGGSLLARWEDANLPPYGMLYALVRSGDQSQAVKQYGAEPLLCDLGDHEKLRERIISNEISIIFFLVDSASDQHQPTMIRALHEVKTKTGKEVHFLHTGGAKHFSSHAGLTTEKLLLDTDPDLYNTLKNSVAPHPYFAQTTKTNLSIIDLCEEYGVRGYIFVPCIVYGKGEGFGNKISIQVVAIIKAAHKARRVYDVNGLDASWPVCHIVDNSTLYLQVLRNMLLGTEMGYNKQGFYLASSGSINWRDIYHAFAVALAKRGVVDDDVVKSVDDAALTQMAEGLGVPESLVPVMLGGRCTLTPVHGGQIGWKSQFLPENIIETADDEVDFILENLDLKN